MIRDKLSILHCSSLGKQSFYRWYWHIRAHECVREVVSHFAALMQANHTSTRICARTETPLNISHGRVFRVKWSLSGLSKYSYIWCPAAVCTHACKYHTDTSHAHGLHMCPCSVCANQSHARVFLLKDIDKSDNHCSYIYKWAKEKKTHESHKEWRYQMKKSANATEAKQLTGSTGDSRRVREAGDTVRGAENRPAGTAALPVSLQQAWSKIPFGSSKI